MAFLCALVKIHQTAGRFFREATTTLNLAPLVAAVRLRCEFCGEESQPSAPGAARDGWAMKKGMARP